MNAEQVNADIARKARWHRDELRLGQEAVAVRMQRLGFGWTLNTVSDVENGRRNLKACELVALADALSCNPMALLPYPASVPA